MFRLAIMSMALLLSGCVSLMEIEAYSVSDPSERISSEDSFLVIYYSDDWESGHYLDRVARAIATKGIDADTESNFVKRNVDPRYAIFYEFINSKKQENFNAIIPEFGELNSSLSKSNCSQNLLGEVECISSKTHAYGLKSFSTSSSTREYDETEFKVSVYDYKYIDKDGNPKQVLKAGAKTRFDGCDKEYIYTQLVAYTVAYMREGSYTKKSFEVDATNCNLE
ncbi:hypothetical protein ACR0WA_000542 [Vibrio cholerae]|uniref:hypothetical protein n=2 Tax=Vibrio cholerae TaxID=666 RepID=UPI0000EF9A66|nr:hypothetical protein [Vibrio cholerae]EGR2105464.1 hypothetical protein [Vibrio cholerae]KNH58049.1 hypothetical protein A55_1867 [Vibrio cholerae 1587]WOQ95677.1 hypothetical protein R4538_07540 [Vibrio cholerae]